MIACITSLHKRERGREGQGEGWRDTERGIQGEGQGHGEIERVFFNTVFFNSYEPMDFVVSSHAICNFLRARGVKSFLLSFLD